MNPYTSPAEGVDPSPRSPSAGRSTWSVLADRMVNHLPTVKVEHEWLMFWCQRCDTPFRVQRIAKCCVRCIEMAARAEVVGGEWIGEVSGA